MNSEILLDLPCDEELWAAKTEGEWQNLGGSAAATMNAVSFAQSLSTLLSANDRQDPHYSSSASNSNSPLSALQPGMFCADSGIIPSTFGCLFLINALHNCIWETRTRQHNTQWTQRETHLNFSRIELALNAWLVAWKANERHKLERPNPFGLGPIPADSIPLLELAYVHVFFNLGWPQENFLRRKFDAFDDELALRTEIRQHAEGYSNSEGTDSASDAQSSKASRRM
ncbi:hypothetical protein LTR56_024133 [Elasticomyces elasticus]|nr:hypothetical protein LTR56_024133 [Elasticomyces elasticus]KAK3622030.1 hypothetical protein LTR22_024972 [Elasticomyces elasticus]KAK4908031.1 hypothetical protein LTR49_023020 [Elasticomyces elasticus]KAK5732997.1 hypothetical protein LTS12_027022 [Elasticomyces elasticus]